MYPGPHRTPSHNLIRLSRSLRTGGKRVEKGITGPQWFKELFEGGTKAVSRMRNVPAVTTIER